MRQEPFDPNGVAALLAWSHTLSSTTLPAVAGLFMSHAKSSPMISCHCVDAIAGQGLNGDRYALGEGFYSGKNGWGAPVTLIQKEAIDAVNFGQQANFRPEMLRRNILTVNIDLSLLLGRTFRCGKTVLRGVKPYPPCAHLAYLLGKPEVLKYFAHACGIGADIVEGGSIQVGDCIELADE